MLRSRDEVHSRGSSILSGILALAVLGSVSFAIAPTVTLQSQLATTLAVNTTQTETTPGDQGEEKENAIIEDNVASKLNWKDVDGVTYDVHYACTQKTSDANQLKQQCKPGFKYKVSASKEGVITVTPSVTSACFRAPPPPDKKCSQGEPLTSCNTPGTVNDCFVEYCDASDKCSTAVVDPNTQIINNEKLGKIAEASTGKSLAELAERLKTPSMPVQSTDSSGQNIINAAYGAKEAELEKIRTERTDIAKQIQGFQACNLTTCIQEVEKLRARDTELVKLQQNVVADMQRLKPPTTFSGFNMNAGVNTDPTPPGIVPSTFQSEKGSFDSQPAGQGTGFVDSSFWSNITKFPSAITSATKALTDNLSAAGKYIQETVFPAISNTYKVATEQAEQGTGFAGSSFWSLSSLTNATKSIADGLSTAGKYIQETVFPAISNTYKVATEQVQPGAGSFREAQDVGFDPTSGSLLDPNAEYSRAFGQRRADSLRSLAENIRRAEPTTSDTFRKIKEAVDRAQAEDFSTYPPDVSKELSKARNDLVNAYDGYFEKVMEYNQTADSPIEFPAEESTSIASSERSNIPSIVPNNTEAVSASPDPQIEAIRKAQASYSGDSIVEFCKAAGYTDCGSRGKDRLALAKAAGFTEETYNPSRDNPDVLKKLREIASGDATINSAENVPLPRPRPSTGAGMVSPDSSNDSYLDERFPKQTVTVDGKEIPLPSTRPTRETPTENRGITSVNQASLDPEVAQIREQAIKSGISQTEADKLIAAAGDDVNRQKGNLLVPMLAGKTECSQSAKSVYDCLKAAGTCFDKACRADVFAPVVGVDPAEILKRDNAKGNIALFNGLRNLSTYTKEEVVAKVIESSPQYNPLADVLTPPPTKEAGDQNTGLFGIGNGIRTATKYIADTANQTTQYLRNTLPGLYNDAYTSYVTDLELRRDAQGSLVKIADGLRFDMNNTGNDATLTITNNGYSIQRIGGSVRPLDITFPEYQRILPEGIVEQKITYQDNPSGYIFPKNQRLDPNRWGDTALFGANTDRIIVETKYADGRVENFALNNVNLAGELNYNPVRETFSGNLKPSEIPSSKSNYLTPSPVTNINRPVVTGIANLSDMQNTTAVYPSLPNSLNSIAIREGSIQINRSGSWFTCNIVTQCSQTFNTNDALYQAVKQQGIRDIYISSDSAVYVSVYDAKNPLFYSRYRIPIAPPSGGTSAGEFLNNVLQSYATLRYSQ